MSILKFRRRGEASPTDNLADFIDFAKSTTTLTTVDWESNDWNITAYVPMRARGVRESHAHFCSLDDSVSTRTKSRFLHPSFINFAKAVFSDVIRRLEPAEFNRWMYALRLLEAALLEITSSGCPTKATAAVFERAAELAKRRYKDPFSVGGLLERLLSEYLIPNNLLNQNILWVSPFPWKKPRRNDEVHNDSSVAERLPDLKSILALGEIHHTSERLNDKIVTSWVSLALFAPSRASEILSLPDKCKTLAQDGNEEAFGIQWRPAKGGQPLTKFATNSDSEDVARKAIDFLIEFGAPARKAAAWYEENPTSLYLPDGFEHLRNQPLTLWEITQILGRDSVPRSLKPSNDLSFERLNDFRTADRSRMGPKTTERKSASLWSFESVERSVLARLPKSFPILDDVSGLHWKDALFVLPANCFRQGADYLRHVPAPVSLSMINHQLGANPHDLTVFSRNSMLDGNGKPWEITSHQFRHFLNTLAQSKYLSQSLIAFWSGRRSLSHNDFYNHLPQEAMLEKWKLMASQSPDMQVKGPLKKKISEMSVRFLISEQDALRFEAGSILSHQFGLCRHDFSLAPCPKDRDCSMCGESFYMVGDEKAISVARHQVAMHKRAVGLCRQEMECGDPNGVQAWLDRNADKYERWQLLLDMLTDPSSERGTMISLPPPKISQTKVGLSISVAQATAEA